jgi:hypothetical protein
LKEIAALKQAAAEQGMSWAVLLFDCCNFSCAQDLCDAREWNRPADARYVGWLGL